MKKTTIGRGIKMTIAFHRIVGWFLCMTIFLSSFSYADIIPERTQSQIPPPPKTTREFALYTLPKTGTHLMLPLLQIFTGRKNFGLEAFPRLTPCPDYDLLCELNKDMTKVQLHWVRQYYPLDLEVFNQVVDSMWSRNQFFYRHIPYTPSMEANMIKRDAVVFHVIRDPRDFIVSLLNHLLNLGVFLYNPAWFRSLSTDEQIRTILLGTDVNNSGPTLIRRFIGWKDSPVACVLQFEKLMGPKGGAYDQETQIAELRKITDALDIEISDEGLLEAYEKSYGQSRYFYKGIVGTWKDYFNEENKQLFKEVLGDLVISLGYEKDNNW